MHTIAPIQDGSPEPDPTNPGSNDTTHSSLDRVPPSLLHSIAILVWIGALAGCVWLSWNRSFLLAAIGGVLCVIAIPLLAARAWQDRLTASLVMPFIGLGLVGGITLYFALFKFPWFEAVFNGKASGPLGFVVFAVSFSLAGGFVGYRCVGLTRRLLRHDRTSRSR